VTERFLKRIKLAEQTSAPLGVGAFIEGNVLLVGEQCSDPVNDTNQYVFCSSKGCSGWLNRLLDAENLPEERFFWVNALNNDGTRVDLSALSALLKPGAILALGSIAKKSCEDHGVSFEYFYHPQYWKRFQSKHPYPLLARLKELTSR
jgi:hypothetical protein